MLLKDEIHKLGAEFAGYLHTFELKFVHGKLYQKFLAPHPTQEPAHVWAPVVNETPPEADAVKEPTPEPTPQPPVTPSAP